MYTVLKETESYVVMCAENTNLSKKNLFCSVCDYALKTQDDAYTNEKFDCCHDCYLRFAESRKKQWLDGWRPKKEDLERIRIERDRIFIK